MNYKTIHLSEIKDFNETLEKHGYNISDFELQEEDLTRYTDATFVPKGKVTVVKMSSDVQKTYNTGNDSKWVAEFSTDLEEGLYR